MGLSPSDELTSLATPGGEEKMQTITLDIQSSRVYLRGNTFAAKDQIKAAGGHWDADARAWWIGKTKLAEAQRIAAAPVAASATTERKPETVSDDTVIVGKASYKGKSGYLVLWTGTTSRGQAAKLAFRDGSKIFWANLSEVCIEKRYHCHEYRGHSEPGMTFGRLNRLRDDFKAGKASGKSDMELRPEGGRYCEACGHDGDACADMDCTCRSCDGMMR